VPRSSPTVAISGKETSDAWVGAIATLVTAIKAGRLADGFVAAIERCATELARNIPPVKPKSNELSGRVIEI